MTTASESIEQMSPPVGTTTGAAPPGSVTDQRGSSRRRRPRRKWGLWLAFGWLGLVIGCAILAPLLPIASPYEPVATGLRPPGFYLPEPAGTDTFGRSTLSRLVYGGRQSLLISAVAVSIAFIVGGTIGIVAGYRRRGFDRVVSTFVDAILSIPGLIFLLAIVAVMTPSARTLMIALGFLAIPGLIRVSRAQTIAIVQRDYVLAGRTMGASDARIMRRYVAPLVITRLITISVIMLSALIVAEGSLSFLGKGVPPPTPSWGGMIAAGRGQLASAPYLVMLPSAVLLFTVMSLTVIGEWLNRRQSTSSLAR